MKSITRSYFETFKPMPSACVALAVAWAVTAVCGLAFGRPGPSDDTDVTVSIDTVVNAVRSDGFGEYFTTKSKNNVNFKVRALIDGARLSLVTWDSPSRSIVLDFPPRQDSDECRPDFGQGNADISGPISVHGNLHVQLTESFTAIPEGETRYGTAELIFPDNKSDTWQLDYGLVSVFVRAGGGMWTIQTASQASLTNMSEGKPNKPAQVCASGLTMPFSLTVRPQ